MKMGGTLNSIVFVFFVIGSAFFMVKKGEASDLCVFSTEDLKAILRESEIEDFLSYNFSPRLQLSNDRKKLFVQGRNNDPSVVIDSAGNLSVLDKPWGPDGVYFWQSGDACIRFNAYGEERGIKVGGENSVSLELLDREQVPIVDSSFSILGRRYAESSGMNGFKLIRMSDFEEIGRGEGKLIHLEAGPSYVIAIVSEGSGSIFRVMKYDYEGSRTPIVMIEIFPPKEKRDGYLFAFSDFELSTDKFSFVEYSIPGGKGGDRIWIFDGTTRRFLSPINRELQNGHVFALFTEASLCSIIAPANEN